MTCGVWSGDLVGDSFSPPNFQTWMLLRYGCDVVSINFGIHFGGHFSLRSELHGALSPALCEFPKLKSLDLVDTRVSGDLAMLAKCKELQTLDLSWTNVAGDLKAIGNAVWLEYLSLPDTKVEGDIKALQNTTKLKYLLLSNTKVEGNIEALYKLTELEDLDLENTNVSGYMASLREAKDLEDYNVKITGSRIAGAKCLSPWGLLPEPLSLLGRCSFIRSGGSATRGHLTVSLAKAGALLNGVPLPTLSPVMV